MRQIAGDLVEATTITRCFRCLRTSNLSGATITGDLISGTSGVSNLSGASVAEDQSQCTSGVLYASRFRCKYCRRLNFRYKRRLRKYLRHNSYRSNRQCCHIKCTTTGNVTNLGVTTTLTGITAIFATGEFTAITGETLTLTGNGAGKWSKPYCFWRCQRWCVQC